MVADELSAMAEELDEEDSDGSEDELELEEREWQGETYAVDPETNAIYDVETGDVIGVWDDEAGAQIGEVEEDTDDEEDD